MIINIFRYREYIIKNAWLSLRNRYVGTSLGLFWNVVQPLIMIIVYFLVFSLIFTPAWTNPETSQHNKFFFAVYLCSGFLPWNAFMECVVNGTKSFLNNATFLKKLSIPEQVFVAQEVVTASYGLLISFSILLVVSISLGNYPTVYWLLLPLFFVLFQCLGFGFGLFLGVMNVFFRDIGHMIYPLFQVWFWLTPVIYPISILPKGFKSLMIVNPAYPYIVAIRDVFLYNRMPEKWVWWAMLGWGLFASASAYLVLLKLRPEIRDNI